MSEHGTNPDPLEMLKSIWGSLGIPVSGMFMPTLDEDEIEKKLRELRVVETWLQVNLQMLQAMVKNLELQKNTLANFKSGLGSAQSAMDAGTNPFANPMMWPWNLMQQTPAANAPVPAANSSEPKVANRKPRRKPPAA